MTVQALFSYDDLPDLMAAQPGQGKHAVLTASTIDVLWALYSRVLNVDPDRLADPERDRFVMSKGHAPAALYAVLAAHGFIDRSVLGGFGAYDSMLGRHPDRLLVPGVEVSSGSLGHGLPIAIGIALALRAHNRQRPRVICLMGDGECDEGSVHEAIAFAARATLDNLTVVVVDNVSATHGWPGGIAARFAVEGWDTAEVDGHDHEQLVTALRLPTRGVPAAVIAHHDAAVRS